MMSYLRYGDYQGSVTYADGTLLIQILHIDDLITAECSNAADAQSVFEDLVEDYLETCRELGRSPMKPFKGSFNVRISPKLHRTIVMQAAEAGMSLNSYVERALEEKADAATSFGKHAAVNYFRSLQLNESWRSGRVLLRSKTARSPVTAVRLVEMIEESAETSKWLPVQ